MKHAMKQGGALAVNHKNPSKNNSEIKKIGGNKEKDITSRRKADICPPKTPSSKIRKGKDADWKIKSKNYKATYGNIWQHIMATYGNIRQHMATYGNIWQMHVPELPEQKSTTRNKH